MAHSGIDMALWDVRGKAAGWPLHNLLGGATARIPAYAGGVSLGYQPPASLVEQVLPLSWPGYRAVKLRVGDTPDATSPGSRRCARPSGRLTILVDANTGYTLATSAR